MISAQNHQQPLNGNKICSIFFLLTIMLLGLSSCELFRKLPDDPDRKTNQGDELDPIQGRRVYDPETGTYVIVEDVPTEKMDTIRWKELAESVYPPITSQGVAPPPTRPGTVGSGNTGQPIGAGIEGGQTLSSYNVGVLLPFLTDQYNSETSRISENSTWAVHFYGGLQMAYDGLRAKGVNLNINVLDSRGNASTVNGLIRSNPDFQSSHLIIGPYRRENVGLVAEEVKRKGNVLVSPYSAASNITSQNANYVQVNPTFESHCQAIMQHVYSRYSARSVVLVARDDPSEIARLAYFQDEYRRLNALRDTNRLEELVISGDANDLTSFNLKPMLESNDTTVFILPIWSDETFVYTFLNKLDNSRSPYEPVVVFGMPQWMSYQRIDVELYENLNVHVSSSVFVDLLDTDIQNFRKRFFDRYGTIPKDEAFVGYDVMLYFGEMLHKYGTRFQFALDTEPADLLHTKFKFERVYAPSPGQRFNERPILDYFENKHLNILKFKNYRFSRAN